MYDPFSYPEREIALLKQRAREIAEAPPLETEPESSLSVLEFRLAHEAYALDMASIAQVLALRDYAPLPFAPKMLLGIAYLRGQMLSIFDARPLLDLPAPGLTELNRVVVLASNGREIGMVVDSIERVVRVRKDQISDRLPAHAERHDYCVGLIPSGATLLEATRLMAALFGDSALGDRALGDRAALTRA
ncbi:MAG TPA: chemotaxis protein CheW [Polyangiaceae bacterium]|nr:chemotaxis protein CheW [Polyangiaceae bacterium]